MVRTWQNPDHESIVLEVNDDGPGVPEDVRTKIFDPFFTTKEVGKGTGLGLTVAYAIVEEHGGRMWLVSEPGEGASFYVELPVSGGKLKAEATPVAGVGTGGDRVSREDDELGGVPDLATMEELTPARGTPAGRPSRTPSRTASRIPAAGRPAPRVQIVAPAQASATARLDSQAVLIVEDETALASAMAEAFGDAGYLVDRAGDGEEALASRAGTTISSSAT
jgi:hypothetical protein